MARMGNPNWGSKEDGTSISGNPNGAPKRANAFTSILAEIGEAVAYENDEDKVSRKKMLALKLWKMALGENLKDACDLPATKLIYERVDGKPKQFIEVDGDSENDDQERFEDLPEKIQMKFLEKEEKKLNDYREKIKNKKK